MTEQPRPTSERIWLVYLACVSGIAAFVPEALAPGATVGFAAVHGAVLAFVLLSRWLAVHRGHEAARVPRAALAVCGLPAVFTGLCWVLPWAHPEPYEYVFLALDRALLGVDAALASARLPALIVEGLQLIYAAFYGICIAAALLAGRGSGRAAFDRAVLWLVGGFLCSYLGYLLVPTLGPNVVLAHEELLRGVWLLPTLRAWTDAGEANPWDCFPSGHTMLAITSLLILWRWHRRAFWWFLVPCLLLIASTVLLHYHWLADVAAGAALAWPVARLCDHLADRDSWPKAPPAG